MNRETQSLAECDSGSLGISAEESKRAFPKSDFPQEVRMPRRGKTLRFVQETLRFGNLSGESASVALGQLAPDGSVGVGESRRQVRFEEGHSVIGTTLPREDFCLENSESRAPNFVGRRQTRQYGV